MRFAGNTSNVGSWIQAGKAGAKGVADAFKVARSNAPDYGGLGEAGMKARSAERQAATAAESTVAQAGLAAMSKVQSTKVTEEAKLKVLDKKIDAKRKAGIVGAVGAVIGGGFMAMENNKAKARQAERDARMDAQDAQRLQTMADFRAQIRELQDSRSKPDRPKRSDYTVEPDYSGVPKGSDGSSTTSSASTGSLTFSDIQKQTADIVAKYESKGSGDYNAFNLSGSNDGHTAHGSGDSSQGQFGKPLTQMTIGEIRQLGNAGKIHATGRYQFTHNTGSFGEAVQFAGLKDTDLFSSENQDKMFLAFGQKYGPSRWVGLSKATPEEMAIVNQGLNWNK